MQRTPIMRDRGNIKRKDYQPVLIYNNLTEKQRLACLENTYPAHMCERCRWMWECLALTEGE